MSLQKDLIEIRKKIISAMRSELMGPGSEISYPDAEHELISEYPTKRYSVGILFPKDESFEGNMSSESSEVEEEETEKVVDEIEDEIDTERKLKKLNMHQYDSLDEEVNMSQQTKPSSMGLTFFVSGNIQSLKINIKYAKYLATCNSDIIIPYPLDEDLYIPDCLSPYISFNKENRTIKKLCSIKLTELDEIFERNGIEDASLLNLIRSLNTIFRSSEKAYRRQPFNEEIILNFDLKMVKVPLENANAYITAVKHFVEEGIYSITVMMVNDESKGGIPIFQPRITIDSSDLNGLKFVSYNSLSNTSNFSDEEKSLGLLYRNKLIYATGHGVSVDWDIYESDGKIFTEFMPLFEVAKVDLNLRQITAKERAVNKRSLSMKYLSDLDETDKTIKISDMEQFIDCYFDWIESLQYECTNLEERYQQVANKHLLLCRESFSRMQKGLSILRTDSNAWNAFQLTNRAMFMQRIHSAFQKNEHYPNDFEWQSEISNIDYKIQNDDNCRWRPFQLAFLLMTIRSIVDPKCSERELVDLIWFPTGGGKTEAYLGLTAFTIFHRRLLNCNNAGTTVLMRYTLRLLTSQQFTRASTLICACEKIRRSEEEKKNPQYKLGTEKITIGLYIGGNHVPNTNDDAYANYENLIDKKSSLKYRKEKYNKFQVLKCPWCGTKLTKDFINGNECGAWGYKFKKGNHFYLSCTQENCEFEDELPIQIIDEELYRNPPTLLFSTVDKFAMMAWKSEVYSFFGNETNNAPDLIIQDELHLISGPLGTMVGIYETAIDFLCSYKGRKPKVIASTATIRQAVQQCRALYNRDVRQFPSPGLDASDSFFAKEIPTDKEFGRAYLGIMPSGKTKVMLQARATAMALQFVHQLDCSDQLKDQFYTLTIYFNSLKELGKASSVVSDDVKDFIKRIAYRQIINTPSSRSIGIPYELTSRVNSSELNDTLEKLENNVYNKENQKDKKYPIHVLLASNMISVGVDISRLNLMFLQGQPKMISEYIQASSRIGRSNPGLAMTLYDASKSRDRSYYEQFRAFHSAFYKYVEPAGVTPFSAPARDRALHATLVSEIRHSIKELGKKSSASQILNPQLAEKVAVCVNFIYERIKTINSFNPKGMKDDSDDILDELSIFINEWKKKANAFENLSYGDISNKAKHIPRLLKRFDDEYRDDARMTLTSLRNVDRTVPVSVLIWEEEYEEKN